MQKKIVIHFFGLSGSGKTTFSKKLYNELKVKGYKKIFFLDGDQFRKKKYLKDRIKKIKNPYTNSARYLIAKVKADYLKKKLNNYNIIIFNSISHLEKIRKYFRKNLESYFEVFLNLDFKRSYDRKLKQLLLSSQKTKHRLMSNKKNIVGYDIKFDISKTWDIKINNIARQINKNLKLVINQIDKKLS